MGLSKREQQILDDIAANLAEEDPALSRIAQTTPADVLWKQRRTAVILIAFGVLLILGIAFEWWLAPIGAGFVFFGIYRLLQTTAITPAPGNGRNRTKR